MASGIVLFFLFVSILNVCSGLDRILTSDLNPDCENCNSKEISVLYVRGQGDHDCLHTVWQIGQGPPQILVAVTAPTGVMHFQWNNTKHDTITNVNTTEPILYAFAIVLDKIWEFNDVNDTGTIDPDNATVSKAFSTKEMIWDRVHLVQKEDEAMIKVVALFYGAGDNKRKGYITLKFDMLPFQDYAEDLPHLIHTANSTLLDITLENMTTTDSFKKPRFALELMFLRSELPDSSTEIRMRKGLDDEHTPGIFEIIEVFTPLSSINGSGGFMQYRPVSYVRELRDVTNSVNVQSSGIMRTDRPENITASLLFDNLEYVTAEKMFVSLGKGLTYYNTTRYNVWSCSAGFGRPPMEGFSFFVIFVISVGLGLPVFLAVVGGLYICIKKRQKSQNKPEILVESRTDF